MITDRTQNDVESAKKIIEEKVKKFSSLTDAEITILERGTLTIDTLNRIEEKQVGLAEELGVFVEFKFWTNEDVFFAEDFRRILNNLQVLLNQIPTPSSTPEIPDAKYHFQNINDIEKILQDVEMLIDAKRKNINFAWAIGIADVGFNFTR